MTILSRVVRGADAEGKMFVRKGGDISLYLVASRSISLYLPTSPYVSDLGTNVLRSL